MHAHVHVHMHVHVHVHIHVCERKTNLLKTYTCTPL